MVAKLKYSFTVSIYFLPFPPKIQNLRKGGNVKWIERRLLLQKRILKSTLNNTISSNEKLNLCKVCSPF